MKKQIYLLLTAIITLSLLGSTTFANDKKAAIINESAMFFDGEQIWGKGFNVGGKFQSNHVSHSFDQYVLIDGQGNPTGEIEGLKGFKLSTGQPVVVDNKVISTRDKEARFGCYVQHIARILDLMSREEVRKETVGYMSEFVVET